MKTVDDLTIRLNELEKENAKLREKLRRHDPSEIPPMMDEQYSIAVLIELDPNEFYMGYYSKFPKSWAIDGKWLISKNPHSDQVDYVGAVENITGWYYLPG